MTHCTVCGAASREGAKFCTSCGARLVDTVTAAPESNDTAAIAAAEPVVEPGETDDPAEEGSGQPEPESTWAPVAEGDTTEEVAPAPADTVEVEPEAAAVEPAASPEYTASWPSPEDEAAAEPTDDAPADVPTAQTDAAWSSWASTSEDSVTRGAPESFATDADQDARSDEARGEEPAAAGQDATESIVAEPDVVDPMDQSHHGASQWESWSPEASGEAAIPAGGDVGTSVRRLLDDLANRIDRLIDPAPIAARGVDADELADQLDRWSGASTDAAGLLDVVQAVRKSPRDVDALTRLADRAPDLELLVRHYQAITGDAGDWSRKLRDQQASGEDDA